MLWVYGKTGDMMFPDADTGEYMIFSVEQTFWDVGYYLSMSRDGMVGCTDIWEIECWQIHRH